MCRLVHNLQSWFEYGVVFVVFNEVPISAVSHVLLNGSYHFTAVTKSALTVG